MERPLQPLRIPTGWCVAYNDFRALDPAEVPDAASDLWIDFKEDLLQLTHAGHHVLVDVGWYPEADARGVFRAVVIRRYENQDDMVAAWDHPLAVVEARSCRDIVTAIETWLVQYTTATVENSDDQAPGNKG